MRAESSATWPQLSSIVLLVSVLMFGVCIALGLMDVASRLFDLVYAGPSLQRWLSAAAELGFGLMAFFGLVWAWIVVASSEATWRAHRRRTLIVAPMLVAARHLPRSVRALPPATMLRGYRYGQ
ncbi:hypothetical protein [Xanthomonas fragariae]|uniref:hypothetical protein n=1 Tax=Xanthomonas fragariae TaxID=48664 RepID=UPI0022AB146E|nr:hypothetical protein [Xanthomonas fragariae]WAT16458.1 hypothetical protein OZ429_09550 [Xanthomonas fragariae]